MLQKGLNYCFKVVAIQNARKSFHDKQQRRKYVHDITFETPFGLQKVEYNTYDPEQSVFIVGRNGCFTVGFINEEKGSIEINPDGDPAKWDERQVQNALSAMNKQPLQFFGGSIAGTAPAFAAGFAKDIMVAQITTHGRVPDEKFMEEFFEKAEEITTWLLSKQNNM